MKPASAATKAILASRSFFAADLWTITLLTGSVYRWTSAPTDLSIGGTVFSASGPAISRGKVKLALGYEISTLEVTLRSASWQLGGVSLARAACSGAFDGATVRLDRVYMATWGDTSAGTVTLFEGSVAAVEPSPFGVRITVKSDLERFNCMMPRTTFTPGCSLEHYGAACALSRSAWTSTGSVGGGATSSVIPCSLPQGAGYYDLGVLTMTSGPAAGARRAIRSWSGSALTLAMPLPVQPQPGDSFQVTPGCDRTQGSGGCAKFSNLARFRGYPFVPRVETAR